MLVNHGRNYIVTFLDAVATVDVLTAELTAHSRNSNCTFYMTLKPLSRFVRMNKLNRDGRQCDF